MPRKLKLEEVLNWFKEVHGDKYDYSKVNYINNNTKIEIICPEHGSFLVYPKYHKMGKRCRECFYKDNTLTQLEIIKDFKNVHGNKYDYSKVNYINNKTKVEIICPEHGSFFQKPGNHSNQKDGCPKCTKSCLKSRNEHINDFKKVHGNKYDYSKVDYINSMKKVEIICPEHGSFFQKPNDHKQGNGCPICGKKSKGEERIKEFLEENNIEYLREYNLFKKYRFDFYLKDLDTVIEYDGIQHFKPINYFGGEKGFKETCFRDKEKDIYCKKNNINLIRISYKDFNKIEKILSKSTLK